MRLESALFSSSEGMSAHGKGISVVGDNVANGSTTGYKTARPEFADLLSEGAEGRESTSEDSVGNGVGVQAVRTIHENGVIEDTGRSLDAAIDGNGFFVIGDVSSPGYSRSGVFAANGEGLLVNGDGKTLLGFAPGSTSLSTIDIQNVDLSGTPTGTISIGGNLASEEAITTGIPANPATFTELGRAASLTTSVVSYDSLGVQHPTTIAFFKTANNTWSAQAYMDGGEVGGTAGQPVAVGQAATLTFGTDGIIAEANAGAAAIAATPAYSNGAAAGNFSIDLSAMTQFGGNTTINSVEQDGAGVGAITGYEIRSDGGLYAILEGGTDTLVATIALADFTNPEGLDRIGNTLYVESLSSGTADVGSPGAGGRGDIQGSALERSTTDIANEFVDLVTLQRGYQANSRTFNTVGDILQDTINLIR